MHADAGSLVSLYRLQRITGIHRDTLERWTWRLGITLLSRRESTPRYRTRVVRAEDARRLVDRAKGRRERPSAGTRSPGSGCTSTDAA